MKTSPRLYLLLAPYVVALAVIGVLLATPTQVLVDGAQAVAGAPQVRSALAVPAAKPVPGKRAEDMVEMRVLDVIPLEELGLHAVMLEAKQGGRLLPVFVDEDAAVAIAFRLAHRSAPRPLGEDLLSRLVSDLGGTVQEVRIEGLTEEAYLSRVFVTQGERKLSFDARPSDSIAMALSSDAKILASAKVMADVGFTREQLEALRNELGTGGSGPDSSPDEGLPLEPPEGEELPAPSGQGPEITL